MAKEEIYKPKQKRKVLFIQYGVTTVALILLGFHVTYPNRFPSDTITIGLLIIAAFPWLIGLIAEAEFPGGWKVKFREVAEEQQRQANEIDWLKFLMKNFVTQYELMHLRKFSSTEPFWYDYNSDTKTYFERELRRLLDLNLIERLPKTGIRELLYNRQDIQNIEGKELKDVKRFLRITNQGYEYLKMHDEID